MKSPLCKERDRAREVSCSWSEMQRFKDSIAAFVRGHVACVRVAGLLPQTLFTVRKLWRDGQVDLCSFAQANQALVQPRKDQSEAHDERQGLATPAGDLFPCRIDDTPAINVGHRDRVVNRDCGLILDQVLGAALCGASPVHNVDARTGGGDSDEEAKDTCQHLLISVIANVSDRGGALKSP